MLLALAFVGVMWPLQFVVVALLLGGGWLIDDSVRDVVPSHAPRLRRALRPIPWVLVAGAIATSFVRPGASAQIVLALFVLAAVIYFCSETVATLRAARRRPAGSSLSRHDSRS